MKILIVNGYFSKSGQIIFEKYKNFIKKVDKLIIICKLKN